MALRAGYYGIKKKILEKVNALPGIKTIGTGLSLSSAGVLSTDGSGSIDYSTTEQDTGVKWIDGKSIYQKTISTTITEITSIINHGITGLGEIIDLVGVFKMVNAPSGDITFIPLSKTAMLSSGESLDATYSVGVNYITDNTVSVRVGKNVVDPSVYSSVTFYLNLYYTKTS